MKALVTGANGFTGSHLVKALAARGDEVVGLVRPFSDLSRLVDSEVTLVKGDICDRAVLEKAMSAVDVVFHVAAYVELGLVNAQAMARVNIEGTQAVMETAQAQGVSKIVYCSTIGVFGDTQGRVVDETFTREQTGFSSAYDWTKYEAQQIVDQMAKAGLPVVSILPSGIFGADDPHFGKIVKLFRSGNLKFWPGRDRATGIVHVDDLVTAMIQAAETAPSGEHYIISAGELTIGEMFDFLSEKTGISSPKEAPRWLIRLLGTLLTPIGHFLNWQPPLSRERVHYIYDRCVRVDASKARKELNWQPRPVETILNELLIPFR
ncbi:NAD-dependent epimerase/dehydratase [Halothece sp. PCC 7418]|uniref:NAD-dependent epimerase/dehydratase family protein n=1 Tax=Halothece sp. (strain PCC 7418) TaxID=65093 RepID=UPI0002A07FCB|nr:NAD-dependent epimerase/dehydratase family protein [Halothece sp. PCC 7418]AFZ43998.1 NAD-dependent epimerase/dehydratase [Halothece sp. PCC 7418]